MSSEEDSSFSFKGGMNGTGFEGGGQPSRPVLRWFGGKWVLAPWIIQHFPPHRVYVEPFGGAGSVLMRKPRSYAEVYNDLDGRVVSLFRILRDKKKAAQLVKALRLTPFSREELDLSIEPTGDLIEDARRLIVRSHQGFGADSVSKATTKAGFRANGNKNGTTPAFDWWNYPKALAAVTERLQGVVIERKDAMSVMTQQDEPTTLHYVDPPYPHSTRRGSIKNGRRHNYAHEMTDRQHAALAKFLVGLKGMVILSSYEHPIYQALGWAESKRKAFADGARERIEVLYLNPAASRAQKQLSFEGVNS